MKQLTFLTLISALMILGCSKPSVNELIVDEQEETIQLKFRIPEIVKISQGDLNGRTITDEDTWILITTENNSELQDQFAVFEPAFVEGGYVDTVSLNLSNVDGVEYTFRATAIRRGTAGGPQIRGTISEPYLYFSRLFYLGNAFQNSVSDYDPRRMSGTYYYTTTDSTEISSFIDYPDLDTYYGEAQLLVDTISSGVVEVDLELDRKVFGVEMILLNNGDQDSISLELASIETAVLSSSEIEDSIQSLKTFPNLRATSLDITSRINIYQEGSLIFTQENISFIEDKVTRIEIDLGSTDNTTNNSASFNISIEDQELVRGDTVRFGG